MRDGVSTQMLPRYLTGPQWISLFPQSLLSTSLHHVPQVSNRSRSPSCHLAAPGPPSSPYHASPHTVPPPRVCKPSANSIPGRQPSPPALQLTPHTAGKFLLHVYDQRQPSDPLGPRPSSQLEHLSPLAAPCTHTHWEFPEHSWLSQLSVTPAAGAGPLPHASWSAEPRSSFRSLPGGDLRSVKLPGSSSLELAPPSPPLLH